MTLLTGRVFTMYTFLFVSARLGHTALDLDQSLCHLGVTTFLRYFLSSLGRHNLVKYPLNFLLLSVVFMFVGTNLKEKKSNPFLSFPVCFSGLS